MPLRIASLATFVAVAAGSWSCSSTSPRASNPAAAGATLAMPSIAEGAPRDYPGIRNAVAYHVGFISGSAPEGEVGMDTLAAMGVRTIISVDGAEPQVELARARGMRYIHLPIGYNGFDEPRKLQLVRAARDAMRDGPVYIHCHHGKHRSAGAAAAIAVSLGWLSPEAGLGRMGISGTSPSYTGLYACASGATLLLPGVIDRVAPEFPSVWKPTGFVKGMIEIDAIHERLRLVERAGWRTPADHPDLVPAAEAGQLADLFRLSHGTDYVQRRPTEFGAMLLEDEAQAKSIEDALADGHADANALSGTFKRLTQSCKACHAKFRD